MKLLKRATAILGLTIVLIFACAPFAPSTEGSPVTDTPDLDVVVSMTFAAMTAQAAQTPSPTLEAITNTPAPTFTPTLTPTPVPGSVSGKLSYPSEFIPPLRVVAFRVDGMLYRYVDTMENQSTYQITGLPPGVYHVVAYLMGGGLAGGYTQMVPCGLSVDCTDHTLLDVTVLPGQDTPNIDPADWYGDMSNFPPMP